MRDICGTPTLIMDLLSKEEEEEETASMGTKDAVETR